MMIRPLFSLLIGALMLPVGMQPALANSFLQTPSSSEMLSSRANPSLNSASFVVANHRTGEILSERNANQVLPIASITKLMTAMVVLDSGLRLNETLTVGDADVDRLKGTGSRLAVGSRLSRADMLHIALMSSENRAASALGRHYPGGKPAFVEAMNAKARMLGMWDTHFYDSTGLTPRNVSTAHDLAKMVAAAANYPLIRQYSTDTERQVFTGRTTLHYRNSNRLVREGEWEFNLSKTGYIREAGRCLVMETKVSSQPVIMVLLGADTTDARVADAKRIRSWLESSGRINLARN
ncbi:murein-DD-endopeptidase. Serine peptidase. MEROPS family S11 [Aeromonas sp. RU39B]|jgi:D-alanyl-D-alanine endopeptidase (penicillin-binding protein 7)|uniref:D-alanyl-D-alanine endopeptidase n=1 Tax=Aeromonas sp. RU39B TaxID=1907416 RepID=UPI0009561235|nr:D-alanyl-D-alanine endopeptidase [Aeromonas sp. RU39B]SIQ13184.1 murein-DD-endopeptidase. Serine peptidase. MEROPS family S11 [Aeromonas sp. RU39B]